MTLPAGARDVMPVGGGDINEAFQVTLADGREAFVKTRAGAAPGEYAAEAVGLRWLAEPNCVRTPRVLEVSDDYLALEWISPGRLDDDGAEELGRALAATHRAGSPCFGDPRSGGGGRGGDGELAGAGGLSRFGSLQLPNDPTDDWPTFYAERRLRPLARIAAERSTLTSAGVETVERVCERMRELAGPAEPPARLHGDLWSGNVIGDAHGRAWLIDPSAYGGHREIDLAMLRLFGGRAGQVDRTFDAYEETWSLADGWQERVELYQLLPLLVHALLFGGSYRAAAEGVARRYA